MNKLSHSSAMKFQDCPKAWQFHYTNKLRSKHQSAALLFGTAIDKAFEALVKQEDSAEETFIRNWISQDINKHSTALIECPYIVYADSDFDKDLVTKDLREKYLTPDWLEKFKEIQDKKDKVGYKHLTEEDQKYFNKVNWLSMRTKGLLMVEALRKQILPKITKVIACQKKIELINAEKDSVIGFADLVCEWKDRENEVVVFDLKTSTRLYDEGAVLTSPQLSLYVHALYPEYKTRNAGFIVLNKRINKNKTKECSKCMHNGTGSRAKTCDNEVEGKRCSGEWVESISPEVFIQIMVNPIPEQTENIVLENLDYINQAIKNGIFHRNLSSCIKPYGKCTYFEVCYKNDYSNVTNVE